jgi:perosamine synthetase
MIPRYAPTYEYADLARSLRYCYGLGEKYDLAEHLAALYGVRHVFLLASARVALYVLLKAFNRPGGVLMPAYTCIVVPEAVCYAGYYPVFADINLGTLAVTPASLKGAMSPGVTVILPTHLFGIPCDVQELLEGSPSRDILLVEDAAPAIGATLRGRLAGSFGRAAIVSFHATKVIAGETGGALLTDDDDLASAVSRLLGTEGAGGDHWRLFAKALARKAAMSPAAYPGAHLGYRLLRQERMYEVVPPGEAIPPGFLASCPRFSRALVSLQLDRLSWNLTRRRRIAQIYQDGLSDNAAVKLPVIPADCAPAWIQFPIIVEDKLAFYRHLQRNGIDASWTYRYSCADSFGQEGFPTAQAAAKTVLGLPTYPSLTDEQARYICNIADMYSNGTS